jgi:uncharacterized repeat protein (TIGR01451 family)
VKERKLRRFKVGLVMAVALALGLTTAAATAAPQRVSVTASSSMIKHEGREGDFKCVDGTTTVAAHARFFLFHDASSTVQIQVLKDGVAVYDQPFSWMGETSPPFDQQFATDGGSHSWQLKANWVSASDGAGKYNVGPVTLKCEGPPPVNPPPTTPPTTPPPVTPSASPPPPCSVDVALTKVADKPTYNVGDTATFLVDVWNNSTDYCTSTGSVVHDSLPASFTAQSVSDSRCMLSGTPGSQSVDCNLPALTSALGGGQQHVKFTITGTLTAAGTVSNTACVQPTASSGQPDNNEGNNCSTVTVTVGTPPATTPPTTTPPITASPPVVKTFCVDTDGNRHPPGSAACRPKTITKTLPPVVKTFCVDTAGNRHPPGSAACRPKTTTRTVLYCLDTKGRKHSPGSAACRPKTTTTTKIVIRCQDQSGGLHPLGSKACTRVVRVSVPCPPAKPAPPHVVPHTPKRTL